jgi:hypothetical protein
MGDVLMRYALIVGGVVQNVVEADGGWPGLQAADVAVQTDVAGPGWLWDGDAFSPPAVSAPVPDAVTMRQARRALHAAGLLSGVEAAIDALAEPEKTAARIEWEYSSEVQRHNGFVEQLAPALSLSEAQLDALFVAAAAL